jgi:hypothetical protein
VTDIVVGYLFDDSDENRDRGRLCPAIEFKKIDGRYTEGDYSTNIFFEETSDVIPGQDCFAMTVDEFNDLEEEIKADDRIKVLFFDWDCALQSHEGPFPMAKTDAINNIMTRKDRQLRLNRNLRYILLDMIIDIIQININKINKILKIKIKILYKYEYEFI